MNITLKPLNEPNYALYHIFQNALYNKSHDFEIKKLLDQFDIYDFLSLDIVFELVFYKKVLLLKLLHNKNIPLYYEEECGANALHVACGAAGSLQAVKFFVENDILTDIHKKSSKYGDTPLNLVLNYRHTDILEYLKKKFHINSISFDDANIIIDRIKANFEKRIRNTIKKHKKQCTT